MDDVQMSETFRVSALLALTGGFLETYTFLLHGHVFANAQTGNIALCGMAVAAGDIRGAVKYLVPVLSFVLGVWGVEWLRGRWANIPVLHWRQIVVLAEVLLLCGCFFLTGTPQDMMANLIVSVVCALQVQTFRKVRGTSYASTMCTGNLRSGAVAWRIWRTQRQPEARRQSICYFGIIAIFMSGAALAVPCVRALAETSVAFPIFALMMAASLMSRQNKNPKDKRRDWRKMR